VPVAAVLGWPLAHTSSPALHTAAYRAAGLTGWRYEARPTRPQELAAALAEVASGALAGVNLTTPHKLAAVPLLDELSATAAAVGAVNTVVPRDRGGLLGHNTDVAGGLWALRAQLGLDGAGWDGAGRAVLLGTGGVARARAAAWRRLAGLRAGAGLATAPLTVAGRDLGRAAAVAALAGGGGDQVVAFDRAAGLVASAAVVVQATTLTASGRPVPGQDRLRPGCAVLDCNYGQAPAGPGGLVAAARAAGAAAAADGVGMLLAQAAEAVTLMTGVVPDRAAMAAAVGLAWPPA
jgi:shikimate dehydrogenase